MTIPDQHARADSAAGPPPGCPAHAHGPGGITRLYGPESETDPTGLYERLREQHGPVAPVLLHGDLPAWLVLGYREALDVVRTPTRFSRDSRNWRAMREGLLPPDHPLLPQTAWQPVCLFADGQVHERWRGAMNDSLGRFDARGLRRYITRFSRQLSNEFCESGTGDLVRQFAEPLPMMVMTQLLGMTADYGPRLVEAARDMLMGSKTAVASNDYMQETLAKLVVRKRAEPGRDFTSYLLAHPAGLSDQEVQQHLRLVLVAAFETTANLIANTVRMTLTDPRCRASLAGGHMTLPDAVEQVLWDEPPLTAVLGRWATQDTELGGAQIKAGDALVVGLAAANLDTVIRPDPATPVHGNRSHLAFSGGAHECPGQDIGRAIADTGIETLVAHLPDAQLSVPDEELEYSSTLISRHLLSLPVRFTPQHKAPVDIPLPESLVRESAEAEEAASAEAPLREPAADGHAPAAAVPASRRRSLVRWLRGR